MKERSHTEATEERDAREAALKLALRNVHRGTGVEDARAAFLAGWRLCRAFREQRDDG